MALSLAKLPNLLEQNAFRAVNMSTISPQKPSRPIEIWEAQFSIENFRLIYNRSSSPSKYLSRVTVILRSTRQWMCRDNYSYPNTYISSVCANNHWIKIAENEQHNLKSEQSDGSDHEGSQTLAIPTIASYQLRFYSRPLTTCAWQLIADHNEWPNRIQ